jgi:Thioredoxin
VSQIDDAARTFATGLTFGEYAADLRVHRQEFAEHYQRMAPIVDELRLESPLAKVRTLAIVEDWCVDSVLNVPIVARFAEASGPAPLRFVRRQKCPQLADAFPGRGDVSRVPTFVFLDDRGSLIDYWSERCESSQRWMDTFTRSHPMPALEIREGIPAPQLLDWMRLRISLERDRFYAGAWRDVLAEIRLLLSRNTPPLSRSDGDKEAQAG